MPRRGCGCSWNVKVTSVDVPLASWFVLDYGSDAGDGVGAHGDGGSLVLLDGCGDGGQINELQSTCHNIVLGLVVEVVMVTAAVVVVVGGVVDVTGVVVSCLWRWQKLCSWR